MKTKRILLFAALVIAIPLTGVRAQMLAVKTHKLIVKGTSSLHDWESTVEKVDVKGSLILQQKSLSDIRDVVVQIPVKAIKSPKGKLMDNKTWEAFNYEKNPTITFALVSKKIDHAKNTITASGTLTMAGVTKTVELHILYKVLPGGELQISGTHALRMSDFKMEPPTAMMGTIKVGDEVIVDFEMTLNNDRSL